MLVSELDYELPPHLIAQEPIEPRDGARLMVVERRSRTLRHQLICDLPALLRPDDLLVFNDTRVLHARLRGHKENSGGQVEALLLREVQLNLWEALLKPSARLRPGVPLLFTAPDGSLAARAEPVQRTQSGWLLRFESEAGGDIRDVLPLLGEMPTPPYIKRRLTEEERYQTTFARGHSARSTPGASSDTALESLALDSAAAPTAGLHFTPRLLQSLREQGIRTAFVTLGVGIGTFRPVQTATLEEHRMHREDFEIPVATAQAIAAQREHGARVVAVGTTTVRVLESVTDEAGQVPSGQGATDIFIRPGYRFRCVDAMLTNFHLPRSTLLAMIAAFAENSRDQADSTGPRGLELIRHAYGEAVRQEYRFFSFGDAMLLV